MNNSVHAGLYVHIPFCQAKCEYCDFYSITQLEQIEAFVEALILELTLRAEQHRDDVFSTVFWGGGTPSLLTPGQIQRVMSAIRRQYKILPQAEVSVESNPGTLAPEKLESFIAAGFNRISMGVQSFNPDELIFLGRIHSVDDVVRNVEAARKAGFVNLNLDLMTAFPGITEQSFAFSLEQAISLSPEHISCYTLIFEPGTVFHKRLQRGELIAVDEDEEAGYYQQAAEKLLTAGFQQYEVSNFSLGPSHICQHNLIYWQHHPYIGFGPSAHSFYGRRRFSNKRSLMAYIRQINEKSLPIDLDETLDDTTLMFEYLFLNLRLRSGVNLSEFRRRFGRDAREVYRRQIDDLLQQSLLTVEDEHLRLSSHGWMVADAVVANF